MGLPPERVFSHLYTYYIICNIHHQYKTWTVVGRPYLVCSPCFILSMYLVYILYLSLYFTLSRLFAFDAQTRIIDLFTNKIWITLALGNSYWAFSLPKQWNGRHVGVSKQSSASFNSFPMLTLSLGWCHKFWAQKSKPAKWKVHTSKAVLVLVKGNRVYNMQPNYSFTFVWKVRHISWTHFH